jgi:hypothetical protein
MHVEIGDSLYEEYRRLIRERRIADDVPSRLKGLIEDELLRWSRGLKEIA